ncbi:hypothetical protein [Streptococcus suis]|uniref:hypothetical protein n=1 Tax=Streptococcus suis TaxID=1307 RepID=UPI002A7A023C|nr:hypothetical protein [Streptococcus suis]HEL1812060.1 hypothetical protein [Streptococcus suis]
MKYVILKSPIFVWLLIFALIQIFALSSFLPEPFNTNSLLPIVILSSCAVRVSNEVKERNGQYTPFKELWWAVLAWIILGILFGLTVQAPLSKHLVFIIKAILGGIGYRLIERYAVYRYHYLQTKKKG